MTTTTTTKVGSNDRRHRRRGHGHSITATTPTAPSPTMSTASANKSTTSSATIISLRTTFHRRTVLFLCLTFLCIGLYLHMFWRQAATAATAASTTKVLDRLINLPSSKNSSSSNGGGSFGSGGNRSSSSANVTIDVVSIGSQNRPEYLDAQQATWASHPAVRHFLKMTEAEDYDPTCEQRLLHDTFRNNNNNKKMATTTTTTRSLQPYQRILQWCGHAYANNPDASWLEQRWIHHLGKSKWLSRKQNPEAWLCAQKRPVAGLGRILQQYVMKQAQAATGTITTTDDDYDSILPDYLLLVDDDTYLNMDLLQTQELDTNHVNKSSPYIAAGCRIRLPGVVFHYGGGGLVFSKESLKMLLQPIHCHSENTFGKSSQATTSMSPNAVFCKRIQQSWIGEKLYFQDGMRLFELMEARAKADAFPEVATWTKGYCFHSDHYLGIFIEWYRLSRTRFMEAIGGSEMNLADGNNQTTTGNCLHVQDDALPCHAKTSISCHYQTPRDMHRLQEQWQTHTRNIHNGMSSVDTKLELVPSLFTQDRNDAELIRLSPTQEAGLEASSLQIADDLLVVVGGYTGGKYGYDGASSLVQFFNVTSQHWLVDRNFNLPEGVGQTHHGMAFDSDTEFLYIVSGQVGGGCSPATTRAIRIHIATQEWHELPPLPMARYSPGTVVVSNPNDSNEAHLHVFGGASFSRSQSARNHWRLVLQNGQRSLEEGLLQLQWEELDPVIDGGIHGGAFQYRGFVFYTAFCDLDQHVVDDTEDMQKCQYRAKNQYQDLHHTSDAGLTMVYSSQFSQQLPHISTVRHRWTRIDDMPFPACHTSMAIVDENAVFIGGALATLQTHEGSSPNPLRHTQILDLPTMTWEATYGLEFAPTNARLHNMMVWTDLQRRQIFALRSNATLLVNDISATASNVGMGQWGESAVSHEDKAAYLKESRTRSVKLFRECLGNQPKSDAIEFVTFLDFDKYNNVRLTWNHAKKDVQYPDVVAFPKKAEDVSKLVQCARRTGYHLCGQNGKHSFESDTCAYGVVIDVSKYMRQVVAMQRDKKKSPATLWLGAGLTLGQVAVLVEDNYGLTVPMGHCATVGLTGLTLVGGQGILSRQYGMLSDYVSAVELVDDKGQIVHATANNEYSDYLWLAKGGGSGVLHYPGIITSLELTDLPKAEAPRRRASYTALRFDYKATVDNAVKLFQEWQDFYMDPHNIADPHFQRLTIEPWMYLDATQRGNTKRELYLAVYFYGDDNLHQQVFVRRYLPKIESFLDGSGTLERPKQAAGRFTALDLHKNLAGVDDNGQLMSGHHGWDLQQRWKGMSAVAGDAVQNKKAFWDLAHAIFEARPFPSRRYAELKPLRGAIQDKGGPVTDSAFGHRDALWWVLMSSFYNDDTFSVNQMNDAIAISREYHDKFVEAMGSSYAGQYAGYIDHGAVESPGRDLELYYGKENAKRISDIKMHRDPDNIFRLYVPNTNTADHRQHDPTGAA